MRKKQSQQHSHGGGGSSSQAPRGTAAFADLYCASMPRVFPQVALAKRYRGEVKEPKAQQHDAALLFERSSYSGTWALRQAVEAQ